MKLRTRTWLVTGVALILAILSGAVVVDAFFAARNTLDQEEALDELLKDVSELQALTGAFATRGSEWARVQWEDVSQSVREELETAASGPGSDPGEVTRMRENLESAGRLFSELTGPRTGSSQTPAQERLQAVLFSQITISLQGVIDDVTRWETRVYDRMWGDIWRLGGGLIAAAVLLTIIILGTGIVTDRLVINPLGRLAEGIGRLGGPDRSFRFGWSRGDEIGAVADAFDSMAGRLEARATQQEETERELRESEARFRQIAERIDSAFWISSPDKRRMEYVSPAYEHIWGHSVESLYETPEDWLNHIHPDDRERVRSTLGEQVEGTYDEEYRIVRSDGEVRWIWDRAFPVTDEAGDVYRVVGVAEDITERKELEEQLRQSQKMEAVGRLAGGIAHDFNNLLTVIRAQSELLRSELEELPNLRDEAAVIRDTADRAADLTGQLLAFSRKQVLRPRTVNLNEIIDGVTDLLHRTLGEDVAVRTRLAEDLPPTRVDPNQMEQVLINLAVNAREAMPDGGTLTLVTSVLQPGADVASDAMEATDGPHVRLDVTDTGVGMDAATRDQIFEPFFTTKTHSGGTGLGLATVYGIVQQSGGDVWVESEPGQGATFTIVFPAAEGEPERPVRSPPEEVTGELAGRVLVVEDDDRVREVVRKILDRVGLEVLTAPDAESALEMLDEDGAPDLVLTDMVLPEMSGRELVDVLRERAPELPLVVMSGYAEDSPGSRGDLPPEVAFIPKPFSPAQLMAVIGERLP